MTDTAPYETFREYCRRGKLGHQETTDGTPVFFPRVLAPGSGDTELRWREASGHGTVYSTTTARPRGGEPYNIALVDLDEGFRMMSKVVDVEPDAVAIGMRVTMRMESLDVDGEPWPVFAPTEAAT
ncbi:MAG: hypothetical protein GEV07_18630 [Streptosporangiales bacterium]|nr:hypothetical protein [Streptosporangiales bacterium]